MICRLARRSMDLLVSSARVGVRAASLSPVFGCLAVWYSAVLGFSPPPSAVQGTLSPVPGTPQFLFSLRRPHTSFLDNRLFGCFDTRAQLFPRFSKGATDLRGAS
jgi:hypothetical protein